MVTATHVGVLYWYTTSAVLAILTIFNLLSKLSTLLVLRREAKREAGLTLSTLPSRHVKEKILVEELDPTTLFTDPRTKAGKLTRFLRAGWTAWTKYVLLSDLPLVTIPWIRRTSRAIAATEVGWTVGYTAAVLVLSFYDTNWDLEACAKQTGWMAIAQIPLIIALAGKNNLISILSGISYEKLNFLHRAAGRVCLLGAWLHTIGYMILLGGISLIQLRTSLTTWGMISILSLSLMYLSSIRAIRQRIYEFFLVAHICMAALFLAGVIMHWSAVSPWIYPGIGLWAADRLLRLARLFLPALKTTPTSSAATISLLTPSTVKLTVPTTTKWKAGQHFFVLLPTLSRLPWETHPFTAAGIPGNSGEVSFIVRVRDGMTGRMKAAIDESGEGTVRGRVEGPYGETATLRGRNGVLIFAGGSGISFALSHLLQIIADKKAGQSACRNVQIIWMVKSKLHLNWIQPLLLPALADIPPSLNVTLHIHVTARLPASLPVQSVLPADPAAIEGSDWQTYLEERATRPRMPRRLLSTTSWATFGTPAEGVVGGTAAGTAIGTRQGSVAAVLPRYEAEPPSTPPRRSEEGRVSLDVSDEEKAIRGVEGLPAFSWSEGYDGSDIPPHDPSSDAAPNGPRRTSGPMSPLTRARFPPDSGRSLLPVSPISPLRPRRDGSVDSSSSDANPHTRNRNIPPDSGRSLLPVSPTSPLRPRRDGRVDSQSSDADIPHARTRNIQFADTAVSPRRTQFSMDHGVAQHHLADRKASLSGEKSHARQPGSPTTSLRKSSLAIVSSAFDDELDSKTLQPPSMTFQPPSPNEELEVAIVFPKPLNFSRPLPAQLQVPPGSVSMSRSSTADSFSSFTAQTQAPLLPFTSSDIRSGTATPSSPLPPLPTYTQNDNDLARLSPGLETVVRWHEGRAEPGLIISQMKADLRKGRMEVLVCGPTSLLIAVKKATREEMRVGEVWKGGVRVGFHAEDFGW